MSRAFEQAVQHVLKVEGGLVDHPRDPGGLTNMGISLRAHPHLGRDGILNLTRDHAKRIYHEHYWRPLGCDDLDPRLALLAFDAAVNHGLSRAKRWLRQRPTFGEFLAHRLRFYARLDTFDAFGAGWVNRMAHVLDATSDLPKPLIPAETLHVKQPDGTFRIYALDDDRPARLVGSKLYANEAA